MKAVVSIRPLGWLEEIVMELPAESPGPCSGRCVVAGYENGNYAKPVWVRIPEKFGNINDVIVSLMEVKK